MGISSKSEVIILKESNDVKDILFRDALRL